MLKEAVLSAMLAAAPVGAMGAENGKGIDGAKQDAYVAIMCNDLAERARLSVENLLLTSGATDYDEDSVYAVSGAVESDCLKQAGDLVKKKVEAANDENSAFSPGFVRTIIALAVGLVLAKLGNFSFRRKETKKES